MNGKIRRFLLLVTLGLLGASGSRAAPATALSGGERRLPVETPLTVLRAGALPGSPLDALGTLHVRLGMMLAPHPRFAGGLDCTLLPGIAPIGLRLDAETILDADVGGGATLYPLTLNVVSRGSALVDWLGGPSVYFGAGVGPYLGHRTRIGGKVFLGMDFQELLGLEAGAHFPGSGDILFALQLRLKL